MIGHGVLLAELAARTGAGLPSVLAAPAGRGKSALLDAVAEPWIAAGHKVAWLTAAPSDRDIPFAAISDLLWDMPDLPGPQREAVRAVLRLDNGAGSPDLTAVRLAAAACLIAATSDEKGLLLADDLQWWDSASVDVLAFLSRRCEVPVVAATRPGGPADFLGRDAVEFPVPPLTASETATLLREQGVAYRLASRVHAAAGGNARLVTEIARGLDASSDSLDSVPVPASARRFVRCWIDELESPEDVWRVLLIAAVSIDAAVPTLRRAAGPTTLDALASAEQAGLIAVDAHGEVSFPASAVRETVVADASQETLRNAHLLLAAATTDPVDRLWHRASAARERPDWEFATGLAEAAHVVERRGDPGRAAELYLLAAELLPTGHRVAMGPRGIPAVVRQRTVDCDAAAPERIAIAVDPPAPLSAASLLLSAATAAAAAGCHDLARTALARIDKSETDRAARARARLAVVDAAGQALAGLDDLLSRALADAEAAADPALESAVHLRLAWHAHLALGQNRRARAAAQAAVRHAERSQDPQTRSAALVMLARLEQILGAPAHALTLRRALDLGAEHVAGDLVNSPRWAAVRFALFADRLDEARHHLRILTPHAERGGSLEDLRLILRAGIEIESRAGHGAAAQRLARRMSALPGTERASPGPVWHAVALAELAGGSLEQALRYADLGSGSSSQEHDQIFLTRCLALSGTIRLLLRDATAAADDLRRVRELERAQGIGDPATVRYHADLVEALTALGETTEAAEVLTTTRRAAATLNRRGVLAALDRAEAVAKAAQGDYTRAEALLHRAERTFTGLGLPLECGRVLLTRSALEKRQRRAARARQIRHAAEEVFAHAGAPLWEPPQNDPFTAARFTNPLTSPTNHDQAPPDPTTRPRVTLTPPTTPHRLPTTDLTAAEQRVVALVGSGLANREIAATLFLSVKTVEAVLTGVYRKLGVRSRTQLAVLLRAEEGG